MFGIWSIFLLSANGFYLPGVAPKDYQKLQSVELFVNALTSSVTVLPFDFYYQQFHFCTPESIYSQSESLGSILFGDRLYNSPFKLNMLQNKSCEQLCEAQIPKEDAQFINSRIKEKYMIQWVVDGLPAGRDANSHYTMGFSLGKTRDSAPENTPILHNHYNLTILYHSNEAKSKFRVVGVLVSPQSILSKNGKNECNDLQEPISLKENMENKVAYSYSVYWTESKTPWGTRWDHYLYVSDEKVHWFSVVNSAVIVLLLSGMVAIILLRALHKDIARYNTSEPQEDISEEFGWKLVHGDVFRPPMFPLMISVLIGNGAQVLLMALVTLLFAALGFLSPSSRGALSTVVLVVYILFGFIAGYTSARIYKMFGEKSWRQNVLMTSFLFPGIIFVIFLVLNFFLISAKSSGAVPFGAMFSLIALWFLVSAPLCFLGAYFGFKKEKIELPVRTHQIPRQIPEQPWYFSLPFTMFIGGILPFGAMFIELFYIMNSIWAHRVFYLFGFLLLVFLILLLTCSLISVIICYFHLCSENYNWWWRSFLVSGSCGIYVFLYGIVYYFTKLRIDSGPSSFLYFGYTFIMSLLVFMMTGTIGFTACFIFIKKIYGSIKID